MQSYRNLLQSHQQFLCSVLGLVSLGYFAPMSQYEVISNTEEVMQLQETSALRQMWEQTVAVGTAHHPFTQHQFKIGFVEVQGLLGTVFAAPPQG